MWWVGRTIDFGTCGFWCSVPVNDTTTECNFAYHFPNLSFLGTPTILLLVTTFLPCEALHYDGPEGGGNAEFDCLVSSDDGMFCIDMYM